jgi:hypothetical protein
MLAYLVLLLAALSRLFPHALHGVGLNITAVGGGLLFFGARRSRWQATVAAAIMALTDVYLTCIVYGYSFHVRSYVVTWIWYAAVCLIGSGLLRRVTLPRVALAVLSSATGFFALSNFAVWAEGSMYPHSGAGLLACYTAALPFYGNDLVSTALTAAVLFGLPVMASQLTKLMHQVADRQQPLI